MKITVKRNQTHVMGLSAGSQPGIRPEVWRRLPSSHVFTEKQVDLRTGNHRFVNAPVTRELVPSSQRRFRQNRFSRHRCCIREQTQHPQAHWQTPNNTTIRSFLPPRPCSRMMRVCLDEQRENDVHVCEPTHQNFSSPDACKSSAVSRLLRAGIFLPPFNLGIGGRLMRRPRSSDSSNARSMPRTTNSFSVNPRSVALSFTDRNRPSGISIVVRIHKYAHIWPLFSTYYIL